MLIDHDTRREHDAYEDPHDDERARDPEAQMKFPALEEPAWVEEEDPDEIMEDEPADSPFRGMWIGIAAAAVTFVLVFAIPQWLGWYDIGGPPQAKRDATPESVITTVTGQPSGAAVVETGPPAPSAAAAPPATAPPATPRKAAAVKEKEPVARESAAAKEKEPATKEAAAREPADEKPARSASVSRRTFSVQIAAFKSHAPANRLAAKVKRDGYPADVRRIESSEVPWVVRVGTYASREQAESARDALARKGFAGFII
jgi:cell division septation protein DedD